MKDLSFVKDTGTGENLERDFWSVSPSGDYAHECFTGELYAYELINHIKKENFKPLLGSGGSFSQCKKKAVILVLK